MRLIVGLSICVSLLFLSCQEEETVNQPPVAEFEVKEGIDRMNFDASYSSDPEGSALSYQWSCASPAITFNQNTSSNASVRLVPAAAETAYDITLAVSDGKNNSSVTHTVTFPPLTTFREYGLGRQLTKEVSIPSNHEWYMDQANTGPHSLVNCGPTCVTMAVKWVQGDFTGTPVDARNKYRSSGGWWYTNDIINYLADNHVNHWTISLSGNFLAIQSEIDKGNIVILCLDMYSIAYNPEPRYRFDKFYQTDNAGWGHFIVIKGYQEVDQKLFFEAYDPYSFSMRYEDGVLKGRNRYYPASTLKTAVEIWWNYAIVVSKESKPVGGRKAVVNADEIIHKPGR